MTISCVIKVMRISLYLHVSAFLCISLHFTAFLCNSLYFSAFLCISLHFSIYHCISLHVSACLCISLHFSTFLCISLYSTSFHCIPLHFCAFFILYFRTIVRSVPSYYGRHFQVREDLLECRCAPARPQSFYFSHQRHRHKGTATEAPPQRAPPTIAIIWQIEY